VTTPWYAAVRCDQCAALAASAVDPDHQPAGGQAPQVVVALEQRHVGAHAGRCGRGRGPGGAASDHQHVAAVIDRHVTRRFMPGAQVGPLAAAVAFEDVGGKNPLLAALDAFHAHTGSDDAFPRARRRNRSVY
jgi:hypothetical protein